MTNRQETSTSDYDGNNRKRSSQQQSNGGGGHSRRRSSIQRLNDLLKSHSMSTLGLCTSVFTVFFVLMSVFPYSGYMALFLVPTASPNNAGIYAGFLSSSFMVGRAITSYGWGQFADIYGRKSVLVFSLVTSAVGSILFGLVTSYSGALTIRFLMGLGNGTMIVARTASSELAKGDKALESKGVGILMSMVGYGMLISPSVGGILSEPTTQHPNNRLVNQYFELLDKYPFILPNLVASLLSVISLCMVMLCVEETLELSKRRHYKYVPYDMYIMSYKWCCMNRKERRKHPSILKPTTSIYVEEFKPGQSLPPPPKSTITEGDNEDIGERFENEYSKRTSRSSEFPSEQWDDEWEEAEHILDSIEFVVSATLVASRNDRKSFVRSLDLHNHHCTPRTSTIEKMPVIQSVSNLQFKDDEEEEVNDEENVNQDSQKVVSASYEETPLISNKHPDAGTFGKDPLANIPSLRLTSPVSEKYQRVSSAMTDVTLSTRAKQPPQPEQLQTSMKDILSKPSTRMFLTSYWIYSLANVAQSEAFPLFAMAQIGRGLGLQETSIGIVGTISGLIYCIGQYYTFSFMMEKFGLVLSLQYGSLFANIPIIFIPISLYIPSASWMQITYLSILMGISMIAGSVYLGCNTIGANRTVDSSQRASMNGLSSLGTSIGRGLGPIFAGFLVAACMSSGIIPPQLGGWIVYIVLLGMGLIAYWTTLHIPENENEF